MSSRIQGLVHLVVCLALIVGACGGADHDTGGQVAPSTTDGEDAPSTPEADVAAEFSLDTDTAGAAETIVDRLGPAKALEAVLLALDAGYGSDQIVAGAAVLDADGIIPGVSPAGPAQGVFASSPQAAGSVGGVWAASFGVVLLAIADGDPPTIEEIAADLNRDFDLGGRIVGGSKEPLSDTERDNTVAIVGVLLTLIHTGYSLDQIVEGVVLGEYRWAFGARPGTDERSAECIVLAGRDGKLVTPANPPPDTEFPFGRICADAINKGTVKVLIDDQLVDGVTTTTTAAPSTTTTTTTTTTTAATKPPMSFPVTFSGPGTTTLSISFSTGTCFAEGSQLDVTLNADGSATAVGQIVQTGWGFLERDGVYTTQCGDQTTFDVELAGTHTPPSTKGDGAVYLDSQDVRILEGTYDATGMTLRCRFDASYVEFQDRFADPRRYIDYDFPFMEPITAP